VELPRYPYAPLPEQQGTAALRRPVVIVGAGPVGLTLALDLAQREVPVVVIPGADHFFHRKLHLIRDVVSRMVKG